MFNLNELIRKNIAELRPYSSARNEYAGSQGIFMDANENALGSPSDQPLNRYPDPHQRQLKKRISELLKIPAPQIFLGNGSDEVIDLLIRAFCEPNQDKLIILPPTYGMYTVAANINAAKIIRVPLTHDFQIDTPAVLEKLALKPKLLFLCSPNNPTGNCFQEKDIKKLLANFEGLVVIDEAYVDFCARQNYLSWLKQYKNLVIIRTFSKAWGMASIRLGMAFASADIIDILTQLKYPYNVNAITQEAALRALDNIDQQKKMIKQLLSERDKLSQALSRLEIVEKVFPSDANFLLVRFHDARKVYQAMLQRKIILRDRSQLIHCDNCLRITVGTPRENQLLLEALLSYTKQGK